MSNDFVSADAAFEGKDLNRAVCPICRKGQFADLENHFTIRPSDGGAPLAAVARYCVHCGFVAYHTIDHLLANTQD